MSSFLGPPGSFFSEECAVEGLDEDNNSLVMNLLTYSSKRLVARLYNGDEFFDTIEKGQHYHVCGAVIDVVARRNARFSVVEVHKMTKLNMPSDDIDDHILQRFKRLEND